MARKDKKGRFGFGVDGSNKSGSWWMNQGTGKSKNSFKHQKVSEPQKPLVRKQIDPETAKYFTEIANIFDSNGLESEERSVICGNALEEAREKELELASDYILSHTLQTLLEGCDLDHLCSFLQGCSNSFPAIAMSRSGSHVAETALKSLSIHLQDSEAYSVIEDTLTMICKVIALNPIDVMGDCYGSHVLRSLLCLCKGVALDSSKFHGTKASTVLVERLNLKASQLDENSSGRLHQGFPDLLKFLVSGLIKCAREDIGTFQVDQYSSLVLQTALKLLAGDDKELLQIIPVLLGCNQENTVEGNFIEVTNVGDILESMKETAFSHLVEVILQVAPESLYNEIFAQVFRNSLFKLSSHHCGNFVVQALISHARSKDQIKLIWEELGPKFGDLLEMGRSGVIASVIAASQRLCTHEHKCCQALATAVSSTNESSKVIVPRILFLENYFSCEDKSTWSWATGCKMHVIGSLILQAIFKFQSEFIQPYIMSISSMEADQVVETAKDSGGARVIETFLGSNVSTKLKQRLVHKLHGHFGELAMHPSGSFIVEKCFIASNMSLKEAIVSELSAVRTELSKTKQGPHLLRKLDVEGYAARPGQWRSRQESKLSAYKKFNAAFGTGEAETPNGPFLSYTNKEASDHRKSEKQDVEKYVKRGAVDISTEKSKKSKKTKDVGSEDAGAHNKAMENAVKNFLSSERKDNKRHRKDRPSKPSNQRMKF